MRTAPTSRSPRSEPIWRLGDHDDGFDRVVRACPLQAHWIEGTPLTGVLPMAGVLDRIHGYVVDGRPVVTGLAAAARTDPDVFRGLIETVQCTALPQEVLRRPVIVQRMAQLGDDPLPPPPGPDRQQLLRLLAA